MKVFTLGYQGLSLEDYCQILLDAGIGVVLDVRERPWSYNRRYIGSIMKNSLAEVGVDYKHLKACGNPSINRKTAGSVEECLEMYQKYLANNLGCLDELCAEISAADDLGTPACLTCYEREPRECHRTILLNFLSEQIGTLQITHLGSETVSEPRTAAAFPVVSDTIVQLS